MYYSYLLLSARSMFERHSPEDSLLIVQCDSGHFYSDLIACARYRVDDEREKSSHLWTSEYGRTHVLFIVHLPRPGEGISALDSFVGFQGGKWLSAHIDDLRAPSEAALSLEDVLNISISDLFYSVGNRVLNEDAPVMFQENENTDREIKNSAELLEVVQSEKSMSDESDDDIDNEAMGQNESDEESIQVQDKELESEEEEEMMTKTEMQIENEFEISLPVTKEHEINIEDEETEMNTEEVGVEEQHIAQNEMEKTADMMSLELRSEEDEMEEVPSMNMEIDEWIQMEEQNEEVLIESEEASELEGGVPEEEEVKLTTKNIIRTTSLVQTTTTGMKGSYQCSRLYHCIQAAVARVFSSEKSTEWGSRRIMILLDLIPQRPIVPLVCVWLHPPLSDSTYFYATLVRHILSVLKEREEMIEENIRWVLDEAMDRKKLQSGGTFRNVLSRKLDKVIIPIFAEVLVSIDRYSNLDLVRKGSPPHIRQLWLSAFPVLCKFSYADMTTQGGDQLAGMGQRRSTSSEFRCQFPFFWLVKETVDSHWDNVVISVTGIEK